MKSSRSPSTRESRSVEHRVLSGESVESGTPNQESSSLQHRILVACIGNIFLGDDGFGVEVARRFAERPLPEGVRLVDFGIRSYDLAYAMMEDWELIILVDAVPRGGEPGTVYVIEPELPAPDASQSPVLDAHTMNPVAALQMVALLGGGREFPTRAAVSPNGTVKRIFVVGCEPSLADPETQAWS